MLAGAGDATGKNTSQGGIVMKATRNMLGLAFAIALAGWASASAAADKLFRIDAKTYTAGAVSIGNVIPAGAAASVALIDFNNQTPTQANSVIKSVQLQVPTDVSFAIIKTTIANNGSCAAPSAASSLPATGNPGGTITLNDVNNVKPGGHLCI
jgi:hypothetical protein